jgi:hypothetical protein
MNTNLLIDKLKIKVKETSEISQETMNAQSNLIYSIKDLNFKLSNYIESDISQKRLFTETSEKFQNLKHRVDICKTTMKNVKDKILQINELINNKNCVNKAEEGTNL